MHYRTHSLSHVWIKWFLTSPARLANRGKEEGRTSLFGFYTCVSTILCIIIPHGCRTIRISILVLAEKHQGSLDVKRLSKAVLAGHYWMSCPSTLVSLAGRGSSPHHPKSWPAVVVALLQSCLDLWPFLRGSKLLSRHISTEGNARTQSTAGSWGATRLRATGVIANPSASNFCEGSVFEKRSRRGEVGD